MGWVSVFIVNLMPARRLIISFHLTLDTTLNRRLDDLDNSNDDLEIMEAEFSDNEELDPDREEW